MSPSNCPNPTSLGLTDKGDQDPQSNEAYHVRLSHRCAKKLVMHLRLRCGQIVVIPKRVGKIPLLDCVESIAVTRLADARRSFEIDVLAGLTLPMAGCEKRTVSRDAAHNQRSAILHNVEDGDLGKAAVSQELHGTQNLEDNNDDAEREHDADADFLPYLHLKTPQHPHGESHYCPSLVYERVFGFNLAFEKSALDAQTGLLKRPMRSCLCCR